MKFLYGALMILFLTAIIVSLSYISQNGAFINQVMGYFIIIISANGIIFCYRKLFKKR